ncbi:MAG: EamA family transporter, partial [Planctomycetota bacterium]
ARVKATAMTMMSVFVAFALLVPLRGKPIPMAMVAALALIGAWYVLLRLPTRRPDGPRAG